MLRLLPLLIALLLPAVAHADSPPLLGVDESVETPAPPPEPEDPDWNKPLIRDMGHHLAAWGVTTSAFGGLETGFMIAGFGSPPGWFQGATVNLMFTGIGLAGFLTNGVVLSALRTIPNRRIFAHHTRRAAVGCLIIASSLLHAMVWPVLPALGWEGWSPEGIALLAFPLGAFASAITLFYWAARAEPPKLRPGLGLRSGRVQVLAAGPTGLVIRF